MVGFRVFDVGLLIVWLVWFFRLRDDDDADDDDDDDAKQASGDPDVEAEFEGGKLKKQREP